MNKNLMTRGGTVWNPTRFFDDVFDDFFGQNTPSAFRDMARFNPAVELDETEAEYKFSFDLPGLKKEEINIQMVDANTLMVSGERKSEKDVDQKGRHFSERTYGKFQRVFTLPQNVDSEKILANYKDGVLELTVPKAESAKPRQIKVQ